MAGRNHVWMAPSKTLHNGVQGSNRAYPFARNGQEWNSAGTQEGGDHSRKETRDSERNHSNYSSCVTTYYEAQFQGLHGSRGSRAFQWEPPLRKASEGRRENKPHP